MGFLVETREVVHVVSLKMERFLNIKSSKTDPKGQSSADEDADTFVPVSQYIPWVRRHDIVGTYH